MRSKLVAKGKLIASIGRDILWAPRKEGGFSFFSLLSFACRNALISPSLFLSLHEADVDTEVLISDIRDEQYFIVVFFFIARCCCMFSRHATCARYTQYPFFPREQATFLRYCCDISLIDVCAYTGASLSEREREKTFCCAVKLLRNSISPFRCYTRR